MQGTALVATGVPVDALHPLVLDPILQSALREDLGWGDLTSSLVLEPDASCTADMVFREAGVVAGLPVIERVFALIHPGIAVSRLAGEGSQAAAGDLVARVAGPAQGILAGERVALNLIQRLSAIATATRRFVEKLAGTRTRLLDTRKTTPGLRALERYAVRLGGGRNHRFCLSDAILIKDNHIAIAGSITEAVRRAKRGAPVTATVEVEVETLFQVQEALAAGADMLLLDNMSIQDLEQAVALVAGRVPVEASGGITLERVSAVARTGVDYLSSGAITRLAGFLDIALDVK
ncbi:MAG: carboxylating nicotinate-nucleotide diphosphorylase [Candidatus Sericytochromatia bacterium]|nr:carboxylating nicotinate-nucleotide diphosphorylase [Candidatus Tanganyikabacteria bacterium]